jgi:uncharacterized protein YllA (UPF0747 family)
MILLIIFASVKEVEFDNFCQQHRARAERESNTWVDWFNVIIRFLFCQKIINF